MTSRILVISGMVGAEMSRIGYWWHLDPDAEIRVGYLSGHKALIA
jgi:hypothetical protein